MTVQLRLTAAEIDAHRPALLTWVRANGIEPRTMSDRELSIEEHGTRTVICYREIQTDQHGRHLADPTHPGEVLTIRRSTEQLVTLDALDYPLRRLNTGELLMVRGLITQPGPDAAAALASLLTDTAEPRPCSCTLARRCASCPPEDTTEAAGGEGAP
ncbi:hypothetical protein [Streptomyces zhihengii]|uniref:Uncharacterized protein n=1 Tax=Streptomyces zhihengii TaxID=1818004 RepID=A0ABS2UU25_9ACTN|nr:hypothetical protein [Streptomyces zhihengii]MBM9621017.1 hypothetical protein [Streptomyces zhihengii]